MIWPMNRRLIASASVAALYAGSPPVVEVWLLLGDSNNFTGASLSAGVDDVTHPRLYQYADQTAGTGTADTLTENATEPLGWYEYLWTTTPNGKIGTAVAYFRDVYLPANPNKTVVLVPYAKGGATVWQNGVGGFRPYTASTLLTDAVAHCNAAIAAAVSQFGSAVFGGTICHLGVNDLTTQRQHSETRGYVNALIDAVRENVTDAEATPFLWVGYTNGAYEIDGIESSPGWATTGTGTTGAMHRDMLANIGSKFEFAAYVDSEDPTDLGTAAVHFSRAEQVDLATNRVGPALAAALANSSIACTWDTNDTALVIAAQHAFSNGNLDISGNGTAAWKMCRATTGHRSGKKYILFRVVARVNNNYVIGFANYLQSLLSYVGDAAGYGAGIYPGQNNLAAGFTVVNAITSGSTGTALNDYWGFAVDFDNGKAWAHKNGTYLNSGDPAAGTNEWLSFTPSSAHRLWPAASVYQDAGNTIRILPTIAAQSPHPAPSGFEAWS